MRRLAAGSVSKGKGRWAFFGITEIPDHDDPTHAGSTEERRPA